MSAIDAFVAYKFIKVLTTPWTETDAYKLGIIDENGKVIRKRSDLDTSEEKRAYTIFHTLCWNIKKLIEKIPGGKSKIGSFAAALYLLKEHANVQDRTLFERSLIWYLEDSGYEVEDRFEVYEEEISASIEPGTYIIENQKVVFPRSITSFTSYLGEALFRFGDLCLTENDFVPLSRWNLMENRVRRVNEQRDTFAGMPVFKVSIDEYLKGIHGRAKWQRWNKQLDMESDGREDIKTYAHRNPGKPVLIQNDKTGEMPYLIHRSV